jgi:hypothetical protein
VYAPEIHRYRVMRAALLAGAGRTARGVGGAGRQPAPATVRLLLFRDDLILDLVVGALRHDLLLHQFILPLVRPSTIFLA